MLSRGLERLSSYSCMALRRGVDWLCQAKGNKPLSSFAKDEGVCVNIRKANIGKVPRATKTICSSTIAPLKTTTTIKASDHSCERTFTSDEYGIFAGVNRALTTARRRRTTTTTTICAHDERQQHHAIYRAYEETSRLSLSSSIIERHPSFNRQILSSWSWCNHPVCSPLIGGADEFRLRQSNMALLASLAKFMSTFMQPPNGSSGVKIESIQEGLLSNAKGNKRVRINACGQLYNELAKTQPSLFQAAPKGQGINFEVHYYDSLELVSGQKGNQVPTVCLLHGAPGHYKDFASMINYLTEKGFRVIAPNFPEFSATIEYSFRHSPRERLDFLLNFFEAINLRRLDMLVGHSSAVYTIFELLNHSLAAPNKAAPSGHHNHSNKDRIQVKSIGLFSTPTYNLPPSMAATPFRLFSLKLYDYSIMRLFIGIIIHWYVKSQGIRNRVERDKIDNLMIAASAVGYSDSDKMKDYLKLVHKYKLPTYVVIGGNDRLIPMEHFNQLKADLGIKDDSEVMQYDDSGNLIQKASQLNPLVEMSEFKSGGHYTFQKYSNIINNNIYQFLRRKVLLKAQAESTKL